MHSDREAEIPALSPMFLANSLACVGRPNGHSLGGPESLEPGDLQRPCFAAVAHDSIHFSQRTKRMKHGMWYIYRSMYIAPVHMSHSIRTSSHMASMAVMHQPSGNKGPPALHFRIGHNVTNQAIPLLVAKGFYRLFPVRVLSLSRSLSIHLLPQVIRSGEQDAS